MCLVVACWLILRSNNLKVIQSRMADNIRRLRDHRFSTLLIRSKLEQLLFKKIYHLLQSGQSQCKQMIQIPSFMS